MKKTILILGGARSGKSRLAQELAAKMGGKVLFVATATADDEDMRLRIEKHKRDRPPGWVTVEAPSQVGRRLAERAKDFQVIVIDCITLLVNNVFSRYGEADFDTVADDIIQREVMAEIEELITSLREIEASSILVSNEVGLGLVPANRMGRIYRDCLGRANQALAAAASEVYLMVAGLPLKLKPQ